jgi:cytochrome c oxidase cbb3-type subunit 3
MDKHSKPQQAKDTGHEWDGIRELTNPPPRWWMLALHASWIWCVIYFILYPSIPLIHDSTKGILGWTMIKEYKEAVAENNAIKAPYLKKISAMSGKDILADPGMRNFADSSAKAIFGDYCSACHGAGGQGAPGLFPVLADDDWLYGGNFDTIVETITYGRQGFMPAHEGMLDDATINKLADFVIDASQGKATPAQFTLFNDNGCGGCHGENARGGALNNLSTGAANLTDAIWRFGGKREDVLRTIKYGVNQDGPHTRVAIMPAFDGKLSPETIKMLAVKVHEFGGGQ